MTERTHLKGHHSFVDMVSTHVDVWRRLLEEASLNSNKDESKEQVYRAELEALHQVDRHLLLRDYQRTPMQQELFIGLVEANVPVWQSRLSAAKFAAADNPDDQSYYEYELRALADIRAAAAIEKLLAMEAQLPDQHLSLAGGFVIHKQGSAWTAVLPNGQVRPLIDLEWLLVTRLFSENRRSATMTVTLPRTSPPRVISGSTDAVYPTRNYGQGPRSDIRDPVAPSPADALREQFGAWAEHPTWPLVDWQYEVQNGDTRSGYWEWVANEIETSRPMPARTEQDDGPSL